MRTLLIDARNKISPATPAPSVFVQTSNLFTSPLPLSSPSPTSSTLFTSPLHVSSPAPTLYLTPKIDCIRSVSPSVGIMPYTGPLIVLYSHSRFDHILGLIQL